MSRLTDLLRTAKQLDPQLGEDLEAEIRPLQERLPFGLNFERHAPEAVELSSHKIRKGSKVRILPPRGSTPRGDRRIWRVDTISGGEAKISTPNGDETETAAVELDDLILVAEFRDRIYPGLRPDGTVERGGDKPFHTVINGENFHALEQLTFTHENAVDAIYIDPPYNTGARDWKYNNDYVEGDDLYRHSKWLAFMERRLKIAKRLMKPESSVLIVTIDEKEYLRLGLLLEQTFPEARIQMVSAIINPSGSQRSLGFWRTDEYVFFVSLGTAVPSSWISDMSKEAGGDVKRRAIWNSLRRRGAGNQRADRPGCFYPIYVEDGTIVKVGEPLDQHQQPGDEPDVPCATAIYPIKDDGTQGRYECNPKTAERLRAQGYLRLKIHRGELGIQYLRRSEIQRLTTGELISQGWNENGHLDIEWGEEVVRNVKPKSAWNMPSHDADQHGSRINRLLMPGRKFPYPKSLYAVEDSLRFFVGDKPDALVLDFFAGSGTTAHAVMRLNKQDDGRRQCISVTNNEVSAEEQSELRSQGLRPGDSEWEKLGICDHITKPRLRAAITGTTPEGESIKGDYKFVDEFPMSDGLEENVAFFTLTYESPWRVSTDRAFAAIAPMLWLRAGAYGRSIDTIVNGWEVADTYGIINDLDRASEFLAALEKTERIRLVYIVTDDEGRYQQIANEIPGIETVRLYEDYLRNCEMTGDF